MNNNSQIELNDDNVVDLLKHYLDIGYANSGVFSIRDGSNIHKVYRILKGTEKLPEGEEPNLKELYTSLFQFVEIANKAKAYSLDNVAVISTIVDYINNHILEKKVV